MNPARLRGRMEPTTTMASRHHNPERRSWKGCSYKRGGKRVRQLRYSMSDERFGLDDVAGRQVSRLDKLQ